MTTRLVAFVVLLVIVASVSVNAQTVALKDLPYFAARYHIKDSIIPVAPKPYPLGECINWWRDTANEIGLPKLLMKYDTGLNPINAIKYLYNSQLPKTYDQPLRLNKYQYSNDRFIPQLLLDYFWGSYLTMWERMPGDSVRLVGSLAFNETPRNGDSMWIADKFLFPDQSMCIHIRYDGEGNSHPQESGVLIRYAPPDRLDTLLSTFATEQDPYERIVWDLRLATNMYYSSSFAAIVTHQYLNPRTVQQWQPVKVDSVHAEVINLWQLAIQKFDIDTTGISRNH